MKLSNSTQTLISAALALVLAGCLGASPNAGQPAITEENQPATAMPSPTTIPPTPSPEPTPTLAPVEFREPGFEFTGEDPATPVIEHAPVDAWNGPYINPGAVTFHQGEFHMLLNGFSNYPGVINVGYLSSPDGRAWTAVQDEPVLTSEQVPYAAPGILASSLQVLDDGTWVLYFSTINHSEPAVIGRATAESPLGPWSVDPQPVLSPGPAGAWDDRNLIWPDIVRVEDGWVMYYAGESQRRGSMIGLATSPDGINWTKHDDPGTAEAEYAHSDPVLVSSQIWEVKKTTRPEVQRTPDGWVMIYTGGDLNKRGLAASPDGIHWTTYPDNPIISRDDFPILGSAWDTALVYQEGAYYYFMEIGSTVKGTDIYLATHEGRLTK